MSHGGRALDIPDGRVENTWENRIKIVRKLRQLRPRVVILPYWQGRHPDHYNSSTLGYEACFLSGLAKIETGEPPFRPFKIVYASLYADARPSFVVDITPFIEERFRALARLPLAICRSALRRISLCAPR